MTAEQVERKIVEQHASASTSKIDIQHYSSVGLRKMIMLPQNDVAE